MMNYYGYDDYYNISEDELKEDYHYVLDDLFDKIVENKLQNKVADFDLIRQNQKNYENEIKKLQDKVSEKNKKISELEKKMEQNKIEYERELIKNKQEKFENIFKQFLLPDSTNQDKKKDIFYVSSSHSHLTCPSCNDNNYVIKEINGEKGKFPCKLCDGGRNRIEYTFYEVHKVWSRDYKFGFVDFEPCIYVDETWNRRTLSISEVYFTQEDCKKVVEEKNKVSKEKAMQRYQERLTKLEKSKGE